MKRITSDLELRVLRIINMLEPDLVVVVEVDVVVLVVVVEVEVVVLFKNLNFQTEIFEWM